MTCHRHALDFFQISSPISRSWRGAGDFRPQTAGVFRQTSQFRVSCHKAHLDWHSRAGKTGRRKRASHVITLLCFFCVHFKSFPIVFCFHLHVSLHTLLCFCSDNFEVAVVYQRTCYHPSNFRGEQVCKLYIVRNVSKKKRTKFACFYYAVLGTKTRGVHRYVRLYIVEMRHRVLSKVT